MSKLYAYAAPFLAMAVILASSAHAASDCREIFVSKPGLDFSNGSDLTFKAYFGLRQSGEPDLISERMQRHLARIANVPIGELGSKQAITALDKFFRENHKEAYEVAIGQFVVATHSLVARTRPDSPTDFHRDWGWRYLRDDDPIFTDPDYLRDHLRQTGQTGNGYVSNDPSSSLWRFGEEWKKIAPQADVLAIVGTGSDANSLLYEIAENAVAMRRQAKKSGGKGFTDGPVEILMMQDVYGARRGRMAYRDRRLDSYGISKSSVTLPNPHVDSLHENDPAKIAEIQKIEDEVLRSIRNQYETGPVAVGGIFLEPISANYYGSKGAIQFYRTEFLLRLRALCDELQIPIFADEIMSGGGRTGKFFAYEHYQGFEPDVVTFGKGLQIAGVASIRRKSGRMCFDLGRGTTIIAPPDGVLKAAYILKRIREGALMKNATVVGQYFLDRLHEIDGNARGVGLYLYSARTEDPP